MSEYIIEAAVLRIQAEGLKQHANSLDSWVQSKSLPANVREMYRFAVDRARDEADRLEKDALELESGS